MKSSKKPLTANPADQAEPKVARFRGYVTWMFVSADGAGDCRRYEIDSAILRDDSELVIDCNCAEIGDPPYVYTATLRRQDLLLFQGEWTAGKMKDRVTGTCLCRLYRHEGRLGFFGTWKEEGGTWQWCGELVPED